MYFKILLLIICTAINSAVAFHQPPIQIVGDEICVERECFQESVKLSVINDSVLYINLKRHTFVIPIERVGEYKSNLLFHFELGRGFMIISHQSNHVVLRLDSQNFIIHVQFSTLWSDEKNNFNKRFLFDQ